MSFPDIASANSLVTLVFLFIGHVSILVITAFLIPPLVGLVKPVILGIQSDLVRLIAAQN